LGDFDLDDYRQTSGTTTLFVLFTLMGVVILLNVLIALVSDSYEVSRMRSTSLFGMARVSFISQHEALEQFLRPGNADAAIMSGFNSRLKFISSVSKLFKWLVLMSLIATAMHSQIFLVQRAIMIISERQDWLTLGLVLFLCLSLALSLWLVLSFALEGMIRPYSSSSMNGFTKAVARRLSVFLFGSLDHDEGKGEDVEDWSGRMQYLERAIERSQHQTRTDMTKEIKALERRIYVNQAMLADED
jgi:hypothetical protein